MIGTAGQKEVSQDSSHGLLSPNPTLACHSLDMGRLGCVARLMIASLSGPHPAPFRAFTVYRYGRDSRRFSMSSIRFLGLSTSTFFIGPMGPGGRDSTSGGPPGSSLVPGPSLGPGGAGERAAAELLPPDESLRPCARGVGRECHRLLQQDSLWSGRAGFRCKANMPQPLLMANAYPLQAWATRLGVKQVSS